jgi:hypothetical protein
LDNHKIRSVLKEVPSGEIALEVGGDGIYLRFDCDCMDALPFCNAACCNLSGIDVDEDETEDLEQFGTAALPVVVKTEDGYEMARRSDGYCRCNGEKDRLCTIYNERPQTCRDFHCTRGPDMRGWRLDLSRQLSAE